MGCFPWGVLSDSYTFLPILISECQISNQKVLKRGSPLIHGAWHVWLQYFTTESLKPWPTGHIQWNFLFEAGTLFSYVISTIQIQTCENFAGIGSFLAGTEIISAFQMVLTVWDKWFTNFVSSKLWFTCWTHIWRPKIASLFFQMQFMSICKKEVMQLCHWKWPYL
jgi:hypothetical protein